jgi:hypothetical protein
MIFWCRLHLGLALTSTHSQASRPGKNPNVTTTVPYPYITSEAGVFFNSDDKKISKGSTFER